MKINIENIRFQKFTGTQDDPKVKLFLGYLNNADIVTEFTDEDGSHAITTSVRKARVTFFAADGDKPAGLSISMKGEAWKNQSGEARWTSFVRVDATAYKALNDTLRAHRDVRESYVEIMERLRDAA